MRARTVTTLRENVECPENTVAYALAGDYGSDLRTVPADGNGRPTQLATAALAPTVMVG